MSNDNFTAKQLELLLALVNGETLTEGQIKRYEWSRRLLDEGYLIPISHKSRISYRAKDGTSIREFLASNYDGMKDLDARIELTGTDASRSELVQKTGYSKTTRRRTCVGFLANCFEPISATLNGSPIVLSPHAGTAIFINDMEGFRPSEEVIVVGVENSESFFQIRSQRYLFPDIKALFVARYPNENDLIDWLETIPNEYLHYGDFDLAGISIFLNNFQKRLGDRAKFFIPDNIEELVSQGSHKLFFDQFQHTKNLITSDLELSHLINLIRKYERGYEQEGMNREQ